MERGFGGDAVACLASIHYKNLVEADSDISDAFKELGVATKLSLKQMIYTAMRHYLRLIGSGSIDEYFGCSMLIKIEQKYDPDIKLFQRPDCDKIFEERAKRLKFPARRFAGQFFAIERLIELYYRSDDYADWTRQLDLKCRAEVTITAKEVLSTFYKSENYNPDPPR